MDSLTVDHVYGRALFDAAKDRGKVEEIGEEYKAVTQVFKDNPLLKRLFVVPTLSAFEKKTSAEKIFKGRISEELFNFMCILIDKRRIRAWESIGRFYEELIWEIEGKTKGIIYSTIPVDAKRLKAFEEKTGAALGKTVKLENRIDSSLIGGVKIYTDGKLIDASVKTRLENIKQRIRK